MAEKGDFRLPAWSGLDANDGIQTRGRQSLAKTIQPEVPLEGTANPDLNFDTEEAVIRESSPLREYLNHREIHPVERPTHQRHVEEDLWCPRRSKTAPSGTALRKPVITPDHFDGTKSWRDYRVHFEVCAEVNNWTEVQKASFLSVSLRGRAQQVLTDLGINKRRNYTELLAALESRFNPTNQTLYYRVQLKSKTKADNESLPELAQAIRRLATQAYPDASYDLLETLTLDHFVDALVDTDMRYRVYQAKATTLDAAVCAALEWEAFQKAEKHRLAPRKFSRMVSVKEEPDSLRPNPQGADLQRQIEELTQSVATLQRHYNEAPSSGQRRRFPSNNRIGFNQRTPDQGNTVVCWGCGQQGHYRSRCPNSSQSSSTMVRNERRPSQRVGNRPIQQAFRSTAREEGLFVHGTSHNTRLRFLVDTGSSVTIISSGKFDQMREKHGQLEAAHFEIALADGSSIRPLGKLQTDLCFGGQIITHEVVVADTSTEAILGLDFMQKHDCQLHLGGSRILIAGIWTSLITEQDKPQACQVTLAQIVCTPAMSELMISNKIDDGYPQNFMELAKAPRDFTGRHEVLSGRTLVEKNVGDGPIRDLNPTTFPKLMDKGTSVESLQPMNMNENRVLGRACPGLGIRSDKYRSAVIISEHLQDLIQRSTEHVNQVEKEKITGLLCRYWDVFAEDDGDLGSTDLARHTIKTEDYTAQRDNADASTQEYPHEYVEQSVEQEGQEDISTRSDISPQPDITSPIAQKDNWADAHRIQDVEDFNNSTAAFKFQHPEEDSHRTPHGSARYNPNMLMYRRESSLPIDVMMGTPHGDTNKFQWRKRKPPRRWSTGM